MHSRNLHQGRYDFSRLEEVEPELKNFLALNRYGDRTIDFANPQAVVALNRALLNMYYGIKHWALPENALCPGLPGRADYIHTVAEILEISEKNQTTQAKTQQTRVLDIGVGASCIYPIIGACEYGWTFVGADINPASLRNSQAICESNPKLHGKIKFRLQPKAAHIFKHIIKENEKFDLTICNPPFHQSLDEAQMGSRRKWKNLKLHEKQLANFGGQGAELWCPGGEIAFLQTMIDESEAFGSHVRFFSSLVSKAETLPKLYRKLFDVRALSHATYDLCQGQKKSRILVWSFQEKLAAAN